MAIFPVFSRILSMTGKINFQTGKAILLLVEFSRIPSNFKRLYEILQAVNVTGYYLKGRTLYSSARLLNSIFILTLYTVKSKQHLNSPYSDTAKLFTKIMRIKGMIATQEVLIVEQILLVDS